MVRAARRQTFYWSRISEFLADISRALLQFADKGSPDSTLGYPEDTRPLSYVELYHLFLDFSKILFPFVMASGRPLSELPSMDQIERLRGGYFDVLLLQNSRASHCTNPRDWFFALQSLLWTPSEIPPNYSTAVENIFTEFAFALACAQESLGILDIACSNTDGLPSWVPDLTVKTELSYPDVSKNAS